MHRRILGVLPLVLALVASPAVAPAQAGPVRGTTTGVDGVLYDDCVAQPYRYTLDVPEDAGYRALRAFLVSPTGAVVGSDLVTPASNVASGSSSFRLCRPTDSFGTYTIRSTVEWGADEESISEHAALADAHFAMRKPRTRTVLRVRTHRPAPGQRITYRIAVRDERPAGFAPTAFAWVVLQRRAHGHWVRLTGSRTLTHADGRVRLRLPDRHHRLKVRAVTQPSDRYSRSVSAPVRVR